MEVVQDLSNIWINNQHKITTLDIKDLYANLLVWNIICITKFWLDKYNNQNAITKQILELIKLVLNQNNFQYNDKYYKPTQGTAMGVTLIMHPSRNVITIYWGTDGQTLDGNARKNIL